jgi:hypothetical protein
LSDPLGCAICLTNENKYILWIIQPISTLHTPSMIISCVWRSIYLSSFMLFLEWPLCITCQNKVIFNLKTRI